MARHGPEAPGDDLRVDATGPPLEYPVWDATTRWIHWLNVVLVFLLALSGFLIMFRKELAIDSGEAKLALKALHAWIGYPLVATLTLRVVWGFVGNRYARWQALLPNRSSLTALGPELRALVARRPHRYLGHAPASRVSGTLLLAAMLALAVTGLVRAGTDLYYPPIGFAVAAYVAKPGVDPGSLAPGEAQDVLPERQRRVNGLKAPFGQWHIWLSYVLLGLAAVHIAGVTLSETRQRSGLVSAMFSGKKTFAEPPVDLEEPDDT